MTNPMDEMKMVMNAEKAALEAAEAAGPRLVDRLANNPPNEPYMVDTEEDIVAEHCNVPEWSGSANLYLKLDAHVETAAKLSRRDLASLLMAGASGHRSDVQMALVKFIAVAASPNELAKRLDTQGNLHPEKGEISPPEEYEVIVVLNYPLHGPAAFSVTIPDVCGSVAVGDLVWAIGQAYRYIYADPEKFQIWGHALGDLYIEGIYFDTPQALIYPLIGS